MDIVTLGAALNGSKEYMNSHFRGGANIEIVNNPDGTQTINASGEVSAEDTVARAAIAEVNAALSSKQDIISDLPTIRSGASLGATAVQPIIGKGLSTNDFTDAYKIKLDGVEAGAEVNVHPDWNETSSANKAYIRNKPAIPTSLSQLIDDSAHRTVTDTEKLTWNGKQDTLTIDPMLSTTSTNPIQNKAVASALATRPTATEVETLLDEKQDNLTASQLSAVNSGITHNELVELVDSGAKNRVIIGFSETTKSGVTATPNADGTITINGTNSSSSNTILVFDLWGNAASTTDNKQNPFTQNGTYIMKGSGSDDVRIQLYSYNDDLQLNLLANSASDVEVTIDKTYQYYVFRIWIKGSATFDNLILSPMCCLKSLYDISSSFKPYVPSNAELYSIIKDLQPSVSLQSFTMPISYDDTN